MSDSKNIVWAENENDEGGKMAWLYWHKPKQMQNFQHKFHISSTIVEDINWFIRSEAAHENAQRHRQLLCHVYES
jgi:hypothetical protein